jgi:hypothetical protein
MCHYFLPHRSSTLSGQLNLSIQLLLFIISISIFKKERIKKNKIIFLNFIIFFIISFFQLLYDYVGFVFLNNGKYSAHIYHQYVSIAYILLLSIAIGYVVFDLMFRDWKIYPKYLLTFFFVLVIFCPLYYPIFKDPLYLYTTQEIKQWKVLSNYVKQGNEMPSATELSNLVRLQIWEDGTPIGDYRPEDNQKQIERLLPYLEGDSYKVLLWQPIFRKNINMDVMIIAFTLLFFGYQYKKDPPQGAYIDKIMFLFLLLVSTDILHQWGYINSVELSSWTELFSIGQYITFVIQIIIVLFFGLRLRFITSPQGEFYEAEIASNPYQVSRWRDWVDNIVLAHFFNFKVFNGRLFQSTNEK